MWSSVHTQERGKLTLSIFSNTDKEVVNDQRLAPVNYWYYFHELNYPHAGQVLAAMKVATVNVSNLMDPYIANGSIDSTIVFDGN